MFRRPERGSRSNIRADRSRGHAPRRHHNESRSRGPNHRHRSHSDRREYERNFRRDQSFQRPNPQYNEDQNLEEDWSLHHERDFHWPRHGERLVTLGESFDRGPRDYRWTHDNDREFNLLHPIEVHVGEHSQEPFDTMQTGPRSGEKLVELGEPTRQDQWSKFRNASRDHSGSFQSFEGQKPVFQRPNNQQLEASVPSKIPREKQTDSDIVAPNIPTPVEDIPLPGQTPVKSSSDTTLNNRQHDNGPNQVPPFESQHCPSLLDLDFSRYWYVPPFTPSLPLMSPEVKKHGCSYKDLSCDTAAKNEKMHDDFDMVRHKLVHPQDFDNGSECKIQETEKGRFQNSGSGKAFNPEGSRKVMITTQPQDIDLRLNTTVMQSTDHVMTPILPQDIDDRKTLTMTQDVNKVMNTGHSNIDEDKRNPKLEPGMNQSSSDIEQDSVPAMTDRCLLDLLILPPPPPPPPEPSSLPHPVQTSTPKQSSQASKPPCFGGMPFQSKMIHLSPIVHTTEGSHYNHGEFSNQTSNNSQSSQHNLGSHSSQTSTASQASYHIKSLYSKHPSSNNQGSHSSKVLHDSQTPQASKRHSRWDSHYSSHISLPKLASQSQRQHPNTNQEFEPSQSLQPRQLPVHSQNPKLSSPPNTSWSPNPIPNQNVYSSQKRHSFQVPDQNQILQFKVPASIQHAHQGQVQYQFNGQIKSPVHHPCKTQCQGQVDWPNQPSQNSILFSKTPYFSQLPHSNQDLHPIQDQHQSKGQHPTQTPCSSLGPHLSPSYHPNQKHISSKDSHLSQGPHSNQAQDQNKIAHCDKTPYLSNSLYLSQEQHSGHDPHSHQDKPSSQALHSSQGQRSSRGLLSSHCLNSNQHQRSNQVQHSSQDQHASQTSHSSQTPCSSLGLNSSHDRQISHINCPSQTLCSSLGSNSSQDPYLSQSLHPNQTPRSSRDPHSILGPNQSQSLHPNQTPRSSRDPHSILGPNQSQSLHPNQTPRSSRDPHSILGPNQSQTLHLNQTPCSSRDPHSILGPNQSQTLYPNQTPRSSRDPHSMLGPNQRQTLYPNLTPRSSRDPHSILDPNQSQTLYPNQTPCSSRDLHSILGPNQSQSLYPNQTPRSSRDPHSIICSNHSQTLYPNQTPRSSWEPHSILGPKQSQTLFPNQTPLSSRVPHSILSPNQSQTLYPNQTPRSSQESHSMLGPHQSQTLHPSQGPHQRQAPFPNMNHHSKHGQYPYKELQEESLFPLPPLPSRFLGPVGNHHTGTEDSFNKPEPVPGGHDITKLHSNYVPTRPSASLEGDRMKNDGPFKEHVHHDFIQQNCRRPNQDYSHGKHQPRPHIRDYERQQNNVQEKCREPKFKRPNSSPLRRCENKHLRDAWQPKVKVDQYKEDLRNKISETDIGHGTYQFNLQRRWTSVTDIAYHNDDFGDMKYPFHADRHNAHGKDIPHCNLNELPPLPPFAMSKHEALSKYETDGHATMKRQVQWEQDTKARDHDNACNSFSTLYKTKLPGSIDDIGQKDANAMTRFSYQHSSETSIPITEKGKIRKTSSDSLNSHKYETNEKITQAGLCVANVVDKLKIGFERTGIDETNNGIGNVEQSAVSSDSGDISEKLIIDFPQKPETELALADTTTDINEVMKEIIANKRENLCHNQTKVNQDKHVPESISNESECPPLVSSTNEGYTDDIHARKPLGSNFYGSKQEKNRFSTSKATVANRNMKSKVEEPKLIEGSVENDPKLDTLNRVKAKLKQIEVRKSETFKQRKRLQSLKASLQGEVKRTSEESFHNLGLMQEQIKQNAKPLGESTALLGVKKRNAKTFRSQVDLSKSMKETQDNLYSKILDLKKIHPKLRHKVGSSAAKDSPCFTPTDLDKSIKKASVVLTKCDKVLAKGTSVNVTKVKHCNLTERKALMKTQQSKQTKKLKKSERVKILVDKKATHYKGCKTRGNFVLTTPNTMKIVEPSKQRISQSAEVSESAEEGYNKIARACKAAQKELQYRSNALKALARDKSKPLLEAKAVVKRSSGIQTRGMVKQHLKETLHPNDVTEEKHTEHGSDVSSDLKGGKCQEARNLNKISIKDKLHKVLDKPCTVYKPKRTAMAKVSLACLYEQTKPQLPDTKTDKTTTETTEICVLDETVCDNEQRTTTEGVTQNSNKTTDVPSQCRNEAESVCETNMTAEVDTVVGITGSPIIDVESFTPEESDADDSSVAQIDEDDVVDNSDSRPTTQNMPVLIQENDEIYSSLEDKVDAPPLAAEFYPRVSNHPFTLSACPGDGFDPSLYENSGLEEMMVDYNPSMDDFKTYQQHQQSRILETSENGYKSESLYMADPLLTNSTYHMGSRSQFDVADEYQYDSYKEMEDDDELYIAVPFDVSNYYEDISEPDENLNFETIGEQKRPSPTCSNSDQQLSVEANLSELYNMTEQNNCDVKAYTLESHSEEQNDNVSQKQLPGTSWTWFEDSVQVTVISAQDNSDESRPGLVPVEKGANVGSGRRNLGETGETQVEAHGETCSDTHGENGGSFKSTGNLAMANSADSGEATSGNNESLQGALRRSKRRRWTTVPHEVDEPRTGPKIGRIIATEARELSDDQLNPNVIGARATTGCLDPPGDVLTIGKISDVQVLTTGGPNLITGKGTLGEGDPLLVLEERAKGENLGQESSRDD